MTQLRCTSDIQCRDIAVMKSTKVQTLGTYIRLHYSLFQLRSPSQFHVGMECELFGMGWDNTQLQYVMSVSLL